MGAKDTSQNPEIMEVRVFGFSHKQIEKLSDQNGPYEFYGCVKPICSIKLHKNYPTMTESCINYYCRLLPLYCQNFIFGVLNLAVSLKSCRSQIKGGQVFELGGRIETRRPSRKRTSTKTESCCHDRWRGLGPCAANHPPLPSWRN